MRYQGRITDWKDERGFGFIAPNGGGAKVFLHVRAMRRGEARPAGDELVTYELAAGEGKGPRAQEVEYVERFHHGRQSQPDEESGSSWLKAILLAAIAIGFIYLAWQQYSVRQANRLRAIVAPTEQMPIVRPVVDEGAGALAVPPPATAPALVPGMAPTIAPAPAFSCQGKTYCTQMTSCAEATFYLKNCPGVKIDGDGDGIPCEDQLCGQQAPAGVAGARRRPQ
jgi:cold shock CspA family protein